jgi:hypothetical protein
MRIQPAVRPCRGRAQRIDQTAALGRWLIRIPIVFSKPAINIYSHDVMRLVSFYEGLGFCEGFRTPKDGTSADPDGNPIQLAQKRESVGNP